MGGDLRVKVCYTVEGQEDSVIFDAEDEADAEDIASAFFKRRGLDPEKCNAWAHVVSQ